MMFKLLDLGVSYKYEGPKRANGQVYDLVRIRFEAGVGDIQDTCLLYINKKTHLVDQFLFTVVDVGRTEHFLMKVNYEQIKGVKIPAFRSYAASNWEGEIKEGATWVDEISEDIKFNNGFDRSLFETPKQ
jgi:hypothetical protein